MIILFIIGTMTPCATMPFLVSVRSCRMCLVSLIVRSLAQFCRQDILLYLTSEEFLDALEEIYLIVRDKGNGNAVTLCPCRPAYAMHIILHISGHIIVDDHLDIVNINAASHDVRSHQYVDAARLETEHHVIPFSLREVGMHGATADILLDEGSVYLLYTLLLAREDYDALLLGLEDFTQDAFLLLLIANVCRLMNLLGRLGNGNLHIQGILQEGLCQVLYLCRHGSREHDGLATLWYLLGDGEDIIRKSHIEHAVSLVEDEERQL